MNYLGLIVVAQLALAADADELAVQADAPHLEVAGR